MHNDDVMAKEQVEQKASAIAPAQKNLGRLTTTLDIKLSSIAANEIYNGYGSSPKPFIKVIKVFNSLSNKDKSKKELVIEAKRLLNAGKELFYRLSQLIDARKPKNVTITTKNDKPHEYQLFTKTQLSNQALLLLIEFDKIAVNIQAVRFMTLINHEEYKRLLNTARGVMNGVVKFASTIDDNLNRGEFNEGTEKDHEQPTN